jgi:hypothetical protein
MEFEDFTSKEHLRHCWVSDLETILLAWYVYLSFDDQILHLFRVQVAHHWILPLYLR